jgi:hypothetical protein
LLAFYPNDRIPLLALQRILRPAELLTCAIR